MAQKAKADGGRQRITDNLSLAEVKVGDRIDPAIIPRHDAAKVGESIDAYVNQRPGEPEDDRTFDVRLVARRTGNYGDVQTAIIYEPETDLYARISGHTGSGAWNQHERDWKVRDVGRTFVAADFGGLDVPESELERTTPEDYISEWLDILGGEWKRGDCLAELEDLDGSSLKLLDHDGRRVWIDFALEGGR